MKLPEPELNEHIGFTVFKVYRAKDVFNPVWNNSELHHLVKLARQTYKVYSDDIPEFDTFDDKSFVYLVSATYPLEYNHQTITVQEWLSVRLVPGNGEPDQTLDLTLNTIQSSSTEESVIDRIRRVLFAESSSSDSITPFIFTISRFCAMRPVALEISQQSIIDTYWKEQGYITKNKYTALCFAFIHKQFFKDCRERGLIPKFLTSQMHDVISDQVLLYHHRHVGATLPFTLAAKILQLQEDERVCLDRKNNWRYIYSFPGYFLDLPDLVKVINELISQELLDRSMVEEYMCYVDSWADFYEKPHYSSLKHFGKLLTWEGQIPRSSLTGQELREIVHQRVRDGITLRISPIDQFAHAIYAVLETAQLQERLS